MNRMERKPLQSRGCPVTLATSVPTLLNSAIGAANIALDSYVSYDLPLVMAYATTLAVLADPTRRKVFERLRAGPRPVNALAAGLPVSRPAVSQHLKALKDAGLVEERSEGVRRIYSLRREGLVELRDWLDSFWDDALAAFKEEVEKP
jgi:DNA-binding transcriptional ArsR family regulator